MRNMGYVVFRCGQSSYFINPNNSSVVNAKRYVRGLRRKPVSVLYPDGKEEILTKTKQTPGHRKEGSNVKKSNKDGIDNSIKSSFHTRTTNLSKNVQVKLSEESRPSTKVEHLGGLRFEKALPDDKRLS